MDFQEALSYLYARLPMYQRIGKAALKPNLDNTIRLAEACNNPQHKFKSIHVAGTNGKGSTSHLLASILQEAGYIVGLYTSPHLKSFTERIRVNGVEIGKDYVADFVSARKTNIKEIQPSFFETTVVMAFDYFAYRHVDFAIIETGLGGRLDSTNIIMPELSVITSISLDHQDLLGDTIAKIAKEKGGIIKPSIPVVVGEVPIEARSEFEAIANQRHSELSFCETAVINDYSSDLSSNVISLNINTVLKCCSVLFNGDDSLSEEIISRGVENVVANTGLKGRWQTLGCNPLVICDVGHNEEAVQWLMNEIEKIEYNELHIVWGMAGDKSVEKALRLLTTDAMYYFCEANVPRAMSVENLFDLATSIGLKGRLCDSVDDAFEMAMRNAEPEDMIFIGGSTFVVAELKNI